jgi:hypothetical protein
LTGALLNPTEQLFLLAFGILQIVIRERGPFLFQLFNPSVTFSMNCEPCRNQKLPCLLVHLFWQVFSGDGTELGKGGEAVHMIPKVFVRKFLPGGRYPSRR